MPYCMYLRKSRKDSENPNFTDEEILSRHQQLLEETAERAGLQIAAIYREIVSGDSIAGRPVMQQLLQEVRSGQWDGVLVVEIERLARGDTEDQGAVAKAFQYSGTQIVTPLKTYDPANEFDEEYFEFGLYMSRRELKTINRRLVRGRQASAKQGKYVGSVAPFGYEKAPLTGQKGFTLIPSPDAAVVQLIFRLFLSSAEMGTGDTATQLNQMGYRTRQGHYWSGSTVCKVLTNPVYMGKIKMGYRPKIKTYEDGVQKVLRPVRKFGEYTLIDGLHEPLVSEEIWQKAAEKLHASSLSRTVSSRTPQNPFSGLLKCAVCGYGMKRQQNSRGGSVYCTTPNCSCKASDVAEVETLLMQALQEIVDSFREEYPQLETLADETATHRKKLDHTRQEISRLEKQLGNLFDLLEQGVYDRETFISRRQRLEEQLADLRQDEQTMLTDLSAAEQNQQKLIHIIPKIQEVIDGYELLPSVVEKNLMLKSILSRIDYDKTERNVPPRLHLTLRFDG